MLDFIGDWLIRASLLMAGVQCTSLLLPGIRPRLRHSMWAAATIALLALPALRLFDVTVEFVAPLPAPVSDQLMDRPAGFHPSDTPGPKPAGSGTGFTEFPWTEGAAAAYGIVCFVFLGRLLVGTWRARRLIRGSRTRGSLLINENCASPITAGWFRPRVLFPSGFEQWRPEYRSAALVHECEHARWRDPLMQWLALLHRSLLWIHPATWWIERKMAELAEDACDGAVLEKGHTASSYAAFLLDCAANADEGPAFGMGIGGRGLARRIPRILAPPADAKPRWQAWFAVLLCGLICVVCCTATLRLVRTPVVLAEDRDRILPLTVLTPSRVELNAVTAPSERAKSGGEGQAAPCINGNAAAPTSPLTGIYFDLAGLGRSARSAAVDSAAQWLSSNEAAGDRRFMVLLHDDAGISVAQNSTSDRAEIISALRHVAEADLPSVSETVETRMEAIEAAVRVFREVSGSRELICLLGGDLAREGSAGEGQGGFSYHPIRFLPAKTPASSFDSPAEKAPRSAGTVCTM